MRPTLAAAAASTTLRCCSSRSSASLPETKKRVSVPSNAVRIAFSSEYSA